MEFQPSTSAAASEAATCDEGDGPTPNDDGVQAASTSGSVAVQHHQQDDQLFSIIPPGSLKKQFQQLFGSTCQVKLQRCDVPVQIPVVAVATGTPSAEVSSDSRAGTVAKVEEDETGSGSSSEDDEVQVLPVPLSKKKRMVTKKKGGKCSSQRKAPVDCPVCKLRMNSKCNLKRHMLKHSGEQRYRCDPCGRSFWNRSTFSMHKKVRDQRNGVCPGEKKSCGGWRPKGPWTCKICGKRMKHGWYYPAHMKGHRGEKPFKCGECGKGFGRNYHLSEHRRIHSGVRKFSCVFCERSFHQKSSLFVHLRVHTEEKPYFCVVDGCGMSFRQGGNLQQHRQLVHLKKY